AKKVAPTEEKKEEPKKAPAKKPVAKKVAPTEEKKEEPKKAPAKKPVAKKVVPAEEKKEEPKKASTPKTTEETAKGRTYTGKFEVYPSGDGYQYRLKASNGEILVVSEVYTTKDSAMKAIDAVKRNVEIGEIRIFKDKRGMYKFKLTSKNYRVLALGSSYSTEKSAVRSSESFKKFALKANVVEIETPANQDNIVEAYLDISKVEEKPGGKYVIEKFDGEFSWDLKASNGQILCQAEGYTSKSGAMSSIESFKKNVETGSFKILKDKNGNFHYNLYTASGRLATIGESYNSKQVAESAALSVVSYFKNAEIEEKK
ncbi:MAG: DUF1508 domain-containing protein, partial [Anaeroplasmataceae bacterium]|nr:DUF1508 domain-containing protein [Anaeroplasmataceae bacterium]